MSDWRKYSDFWNIVWKSPYFVSTLLLLTEIILPPLSKIKITTRLRKVGTVWTPYFTMSWSKNVFDQFSRHFRQFWTTFIFFNVDNIFLYAPQMFWGLKCQKIISTNFLAISSNFEQLWLFSFLTTFFVRPPNFFGGGLKSLY